MTGDHQLTLHPSRNLGTFGWRLRDDQSRVRATDTHEVGEATSRSVDRFMICEKRFRRSQTGSHIPVLV